MTCALPCGTSAAWDMSPIGERLSDAKPALAKGAMSLASDKRRWTEPPLGGGGAELLGNVRFSEVLARRAAGLVFGAGSPVQCVGGRRVAGARGQGPGRCPNRACDADGTSSTTIAMWATDKPDEGDVPGALHGGPLQAVSHSARARRSGGNTHTVRQCPERQCGQHETSMPVTRLRKAAASSQA